MAIWLMGILKLREYSDYNIWVSPNNDSGNNNSSIITHVNYDSAIKTQAKTTHVNNNSCQNESMSYSTLSRLLTRIMVGIFFWWDFNQ
jgi:hypothetical protein